MQLGSSSVSGMVPVPGLLLMLITGALLPVQHPCTKYWDVWSEVPGPQGRLVMAQFSQLLGSLGSAGRCVACTGWPPS